ncbi:dTDP-4-dehydrorhamnose reductase [Actinoplanes philippinensis]|uniref:dTDP-4-dehydrorhamnose reductase n=1 Tax=Actinoplanes philippinensis TaxID=35752 RepID=A0A1I2HYT6_9ACTN|nr:sugar nucleotide-binding protein [Actinoplanes philippinensis]GIE78881.1 dTDP-4-dehydrorhamnose reductase [Actinoplanes philippinensis]SFF34618.1 dTDP-4-dehydrorhamnose reductase [Actinoplanes philippinensis]
MRFLILGGTGGLGAELTRQCGPSATAAGSRDADLRDPAAVRDLVRRVRPDVIVNAAYRQDDWAVTADGAAHVAVAARAHRARLVHVSSDAVFSGRPGRFDETCPPCPATMYGAAKAAAETAVRAIDPAAVVARTSLIVGGPQTVIAARVHAGGVFFTDDVRCPVHVADLAAALLELAVSRYAGVHHVAGADAVSRYELALLIAARDGLDPSGVVAGTRAAAGLSGAGDVRLDSAATQARLTVTLRGARDFLTPG